jgi:hypothetical protein
MRAIIMTSVALAFMSEIVDTVLIKGADGEPLRINASDYDEKEHSLYKGKEADAIGVPMTASTMLSSPSGPAADPAAPSSIVHSIPQTTTDANDVTTPMISDDAGNASPEGQRTVALNPPEPPASTTGAGSPQQRMVSKIGSKFFVVDAAGNKIEADGVSDKGYKTEAEAWGAAYPAPAAPETPTA